MGVMDKSGQTGGPAFHGAHPTGVKSGLIQPSSGIQTGAKFLSVPYKGAGAAMMAGVGCGLYADTAEAIRQIVPPTDAFCPDPARADAYSEVYHRYVKGAHALSSFYRSI